jgi:hypothetical protein
MNKRKQCQQIPASGSTNAKHAVLCSSRRKGIVAFSAHMAQLPVRAFKLAFINYLEECEIGNLEVASGKRCH